MYVNGDYACKVAEGLSVEEGAVLGGPTNIPVLSISTS